MERHNHEPRKIKRLRKPARPRSRFGMVKAAVERKALQSVLMVPSQVRALSELLELTDSEWMQLVNVLYR